MIEVDLDGNRHETMWYACLDTDRNVVSFRARIGDLVPADAVEMSPASFARAALWRLAQVVEHEPDVYGTYPYDPRPGTCDFNGKRPPVESYTTNDHHLIVLGEASHRPEALLAALAAGVLDEPCTDVFVTRDPVDALTCGRWFEHANIANALAGPTTTESTLAFERRDTLGLYRNFMASVAPAPVHTFPPEWQSLPQGLDSSALHRRLLALSDVCDRARRVGDGDIVTFSRDRSPLWPADKLVRDWFTRQQARFAGVAVRDKKGLFGRYKARVDEIDPTQLWRSRPGCQTATSRSFEAVLRPDVVATEARDAYVAVVDATEVTWLAAPGDDAAVIAVRADAAKIPLD